jgi:single-stranded DNA-binding protein
MTTQFNYERLLIKGNLGSDPKLIKTKSGDQMLILKIGINSKKKDKDTRWYEVKIFDEHLIAKAMAFQKGDLINAGGFPDLEIYENKIQYKLIAESIGNTFNTQSAK